MTRYKNFAEMKEAINHYKSMAEEYSSRIYVMISRAREIRVKNITIIEEKDAEIENLKMVIQTLHDEKMTSNNEACNMILGLEESLNNAKIEKSWQTIQSDLRVALQNSFQISESDIVNFPQFLETNFDDIIKKLTPDIILNLSNIINQMRQIEMFLSGMMAGFDSHRKTLDIK
jgi:hypothetical protein